jgi:hypothetical protein
MDWVKAGTNCLFKNGFSLVTKTIGDWAQNLDFCGKIAKGCKDKNSVIERRKGYIAVKTMTIDESSLKKCLGTEIVNILTGMIDSNHVVIPEMEYSVPEIKVKVEGRLFWFCKNKKEMGYIFGSVIVVKIKGKTIEKPTGRFAAVGDCDNKTACHCCRR